MSNTLRRFVALAALTVAAACGPSLDYTGATLHSGFTLVDPEARSHAPNSWLVVRDGLVLEVGAGTPPDGAFEAEHDASGLFALPGLIDAHAHITAGPLETGIEDGTPFMGIGTGPGYSRFNALTALAFGVTSVRNPAGATDANAEYDARLRSGEWIGPEAIHAGAVIQPPPFGGESFAYPTSPEAWDAEAARQAAADMTYFKLYTDLTEEELSAGVAAAEAHGLVPIAHLNAVSWLRAVELGVRQLEHALPTSPELLPAEARDGYTAADPTGRYMFTWFERVDLDSPLVQDMIRTLAERQVPVDLTLMVQDITFHADELDRIFPDSELPFYHPESFATARANFDAIASLWSQDEFARARATWPRILDFARRLHEAGVPLMIGTDGSGGAPVYARELSHHVAAGIEPWEVLRMATSGNAALMGFGERTGRVTPGMEADVVFLRSDPVLDVRNVRQVERVLVDGRLHTAADLLEAAAAVLEEAPES